MTITTRKRRLNLAGAHAASLLGLTAKSFPAFTPDASAATELDRLQNLFSLVAQATMEAERKQAIFQGLNALRQASKELLQGITYYDQRVAVLERVLDVLVRGFSAIKRACPEASRIQDEVTGLLSACVIELADADFAFVRQHNSDGSFVLVGRHAYGKESFPGRPPKEKRLDEGLLAWAIDTTKTQLKAMIYPNASAASPSYRQALDKVRDRFPFHSEERTFVDNIAAEVVVPLYLKPPLQFLGLIVGVRRTPYTEDMALEVQERLEWVQPLLETLFAVGSVLNEFHYSRRQQALMSKWQRRLQSATDDEVLFRQIVTYFTCGEGIGWHRAMFFLFRGVFPSDAVCVAALGDSGERPRSGAHDRIAGETDSLEAYMLRCEAPDYDQLVSDDDALYRMTRDKDKPWLVPYSALSKDPATRLLFGQGSHELDTIDRVYVEYEPTAGGHTPPSILATEAMRPAFREAAERCIHYLFPLFWPRTRRMRGPTGPSAPLGFLIVDSPFIAPSRMETKSKLLLTQTACGFLEWLTADGRSGPEHDASASFAPSIGEDANRACPSDRDRVSPLPESARAVGTEKRNGSVSKARKIECIVDGFRGDKARCLAWVAGALLPMEMPRAVLEHHGLELNMRFFWTGEKGDSGEILPEDIVPIENPYEKVLPAPNGDKRSR